MSTAPLPYSQRIETCLAAHIGAGGLEADAYAATLAETAAALDELRARRADASLPLLAIPARRDDLPAIEAVAARFRARFDEVVVLGTGGSSLGGQTVAALADGGIGLARARPRLRFMDNIDPASFERLLAALDLARTGFVVITKSGTTAETLAQTAVCLAALGDGPGKAAIAEQVVAVTQPGDSPLRRLAARHGIAILDHDPGLGGRFSVLSVVGALPARIAGLDAEGLRAGAARVLDATLAAATPADAPPAVGAALSIGLARARGAATTVMMPYVDRLASFGLWYRQLWAESLGKDGKGTTPIRALGTTDQHSQLQLYLDGPRDKMFTLLTLDVAGRGPRISGDLAADPDLAYLRGRRLGDLMDAEQRATADTLARNRRPARVFHLARLDEESLGALFMHFMLETIIAARLLEVDPFDQPAVEEGKRLARAYLAEGGGSGGGPAP